MNDPVAAPDRFLTVRPGATAFQHPILIREEDGARVWRQCLTLYPEMVCACGYYLLEWRGIYNPAAQGLIGKAETVEGAPAELECEDADEDED